MTQTPVTCLIPTRKIGTPFQSPSWRAEALFHPVRFGLGICTSEKQRARDSIVTREELPSHLQDVLSKLSTEQYRLYLSLLPRQPTVVIKNNYSGWNIRNVNTYINDAAFKTAILHKSGALFNSDLQFALNLGTDAKQGVLAKMLCYSIFLGKSDMELYKQWNILPKQIAWYRTLFADFSHFPKDDVARWTVLRQLTNNEIITEIDFNYLKRISELGDVALKAQCAFHTLTDDERSTLETYLGNTAIVNVLDQHMSIRGIEDSRNYAKGVMDFARLAVQKQHMRNVELTIRMNSAKLEQISSADSGMVSPEEQKLLDELYRRSLVNSPPLQVKTIADLK